MTLPTALSRRHRGVAPAGPMPQQFRNLGRVFNALSRLLPTLSARVLTRLWFTPIHGQPGKRTRNFWDSADRRLVLYIDPEGIDLHCWGDPNAPLILGVHGWRGSGSQFREMVAPLVDAGYQVCLFDLPGHGLNRSRMTNLFEFAQVLMAVQDQLGQPAGVIAHSIGAQTVIQAMALGFDPAHLVLVAPGLEVRGLVDRFSETLGLTAATQAAFEHQLTLYSLDIAQRFLSVKVPIWQRVTLDFAQPFLDRPGLLMFDSDDEEVAAVDLQRTAKAWPQAESLQTDGLGHSGALKDAAVIQQLAHYFQRQL